MVDKVFRISYPKFHEKNLNLIIKTFIENNYSIEFVFETINNRLKTHLKKIQSLKQDESIRIE